MQTPWGPTKYGPHGQRVTASKGLCSVAIQWLRPIEMELPNDRFSVHKLVCHPLSPLPLSNGVTRACTTPTSGDLGRCWTIPSLFVSPPPPQDAHMRSAL